MQKIVALFLAIFFLFSPMAATQAFTPLIAPPTRDMPAVTSDLHGNSYVIWREYTDTRQVRVMMQKISADGFREWSQDKTVVDRHTEIKEFLHLTSNAEGTLLISWAETDPKTGHIQYWMQQFDTDASPTSQPYQFFTTHGSEHVFNLNDVANPQMDDAGNVTVAWIARGWTTSRVLWQKVYEGFTAVSLPGELAQTNSVTTKEFFFADINAMPDGSASYVSYISYNPSTADHVTAMIVKVDGLGKERWRSSYDIGISSILFPAIINAPAIDPDGDLHVTWAIQDKTTGILTQHARKISATGEVGDVQSIVTARTYPARLHATSIIAPASDRTSYAVTTGNMLHLYDYRFGSDHLTERTVSVAAPYTHRALAVNNWSLTREDDGVLTLVWSQKSQSPDDQSTHFDIMLTRFNHQLGRHGHLPTLVNAR